MQHLVHKIAESASQGDDGNCPKKPDNNNTALEIIMLWQYLHKIYLGIVYVNFYNCSYQGTRESPGISGSISQGILYAEKVK